MTNKFIAGDKVVRMSEHGVFEHGKEYSVFATDGPYVICYVDGIPTRGLSGGFAKSSDVAQSVNTTVGYLDQPINIDPYTTDMLGLLKTNSFKPGRINYTLPQSMSLEQRDARGHFSLYIKDPKDTKAFITHALNFLEAALKAH